MKRRLTIAAVAALLVASVVAAFVALASGPGREFLRVQTEQFLSDLLEGEVSIAAVEIVYENGLGLRGHDVNVYPSAGGYGMHADLATVALRGWGLVAADFELALLHVEGFRLRTSLDEQGFWSFPPLRALQDVAGSEPEWNEPVLLTLQGWEAVTRYLLDGDHIADTIVVEDARVEFVDRSLDGRMRQGMAVQRFELSDASARLVRPWLRGGGALALSGTVTGPSGRSVPVTWTAHGEGAAVQSTIDTGTIDLDVLDGYVQGLSRQADLTGTIVTRIILDSPEPDVHEARLVAHLGDFVPTVVVSGSPVPLHLPMDKLVVRLAVDAEAARLHEAVASGPRVRLGAEGRIARPVRASSLAHLDLRVDGAELEDVTPLIQQLPRETVATLREWFDLLESGTADHVGVSGTTRLSEWGALASGELARLPRNFLMTLRVSNVTARLEGGDRVERAGFEVDWMEDRMELRRGRGTWRGDSLAEIDLTVDGFSRLVGMRESARQMDAQPIPGLSVLWDIALSREPDPDAAPTRFEVEIDSLVHPVLRWPIENARLVLTPTATGSEANVLSAYWGGQPVIADVLYQARPTRRITIGLEAVDAPRKALDTGAQPSLQPEGTWGSGRFHLEPYQPGPGQHSQALSDMSGNFSLRGSELRLSELDLALSSEMRARAALALDLGDPKRVGVDLTGELNDASCDVLGQLAGLPPGFVTGSVDAFLDVDGHLEAKQSLWRAIQGRATLAAEKGEIRQRVPLAVSLATATDGFNPFAKREALEYETLDAELSLKNGVVSAEKFEIEGPVRVFATGKLDLLGEPREIDAVVGVFLLQRVREFLGKVPLVSWVMPGSNRGFVGAYFRVSGEVDDPKVETMALKTLREELPAVISAPIDVIEWLWTKGTGRGEAPPETKAPPATAAAPNDQAVR